VSLHGAIAEAVVLIRADGSTLERDVSAHASAAGTSAGTKMGRSLASSFRRLVGSALVLEGARSALHFADAFEKSRSRLENITKNLGQNFAGVGGQVDALDTKMAAFGFTNADVEGSLASLLSVTRSQQKAMQDTALAVDIARGRNISLEAATLILMRVETGHVAMLSRLGIATKDANGHLLTQKQALAELAQLYGGAASRYAGTFAGKQEALTAQIKNSAAQIGVALLPAAVDLAKVLQQDIVPAVVTTAHFLDRNRKVIEPLAKAVLIGAAAWKAYTIAARIAVEASKLFGGTAVVTAGEVTVEAAATERLAAAQRLSAGSVIGTGMAAGIPTVGKLAAGAAIPLTIAAGAYEGYKSNVTTDMSGLTHEERYAVQHIEKHGGVKAAALYDKSGSAAFNKALADFVAKSKTAAPAADKLAASETALGRAAAAANPSFKQQADRLARIQTRALALAGGQDDLRTAVHNMAVTVGQGNRSLRGNSDAALANRNAVRGAVTAANAYITTLRQQHASQQRVRATAIALANGILANAGATYKNRDAVIALLKQLHFLPSQIAAALSGTESIGEQVVDNVIAGMQARTPAAIAQAQATAGAIAHALGMAQHADGGGVVKVPSVKATLAAKKYGKVIAANVTAGYTPVIDAGAKAAATGAGKAATAAANKAQQIFDKNKQRMQADLQTITGFLTTQRQALTDVGSLSAIPQAQTIAGITYNQVSIRSFLRERAHRLELYAKLRRQVKRLGYDKYVMDQLDQLGPEAIPAMQELIRGGRREAAQVNRLETRIQRDARGIAQAQTRDAYGSLIHHDLTTLPPKLERAFARALHEVLGSEFRGAQHKASARTS